MISWEYLILYLLGRHMLTHNEQKRAAKIFKDKWIGILGNKFNEVQLKDTFWIDLLTNVFA